MPCRYHTASIPGCGRCAAVDSGFVIEHVARPAPDHGAPIVIPPMFPGDLRDYFAGQALATIGRADSEIVSIFVAKHDVTSERDEAHRRRCIDRIASLSYEIADALLAERARGTP